MTTSFIPLSMLIGTAIVSGISGYIIGFSFSRRPTGIPLTSALLKDRCVANYDDEEESEEEDVEVECLDHAPNWTNSKDEDQKDGLLASKFKKVEESESSWSKKVSEECKLVLVVRTDLGMTKGKIAAQCSHATLACYKRFLFSNPTSSMLRKWERQGQAKIALQAKNEEELNTLQAQAISLGLVAEMITDAGRTQIASGSQTVLGIGPAPKSVIDEVTGKLKLL